MRSTAVFITFLLFSAFAQSSSAQSPEHGRVAINVGGQSNTSTFTTAQTVAIYQQTAAFNNSYGVPAGLFVDGNVTLKVSGGFGIDVGVSTFTQSQAAVISGQIPHPLIGGRLRPLSGTTPEMERNEITGHVDAAYTVSAGPLDLVVAGGPAFFTVRQDLAESVTFAESPSFDTVSFTGVVVSKAMATSIGFDAGIDAGFKLSKNVGVGAVVHYSRASMTFPLINTASGAKADAGGIHAGAGLRFYF